MKIAISTIRNSDFKAITDLTLPVMQEYCQRHGYTLSAYFTYLDAPEIVWKRLDRVIDLMADHDVVVHMDADVLITNLNFKIEDNSKIGSDIASSENGIINDGVMMWGEQAWPHRLNQPDVVASFSSPQEAINVKFGAQMPLVHVPPRAFNSILNGEYGLANPKSEWQKGDWMLHLPGLGNKRRVEILQEYKNYIVR